MIKSNAWSFEDPDLKMLSQQQYLASHSVVAVRPSMNVVQNPGYQPQFQQYQQQPRQQTLGQPQFGPTSMKYAVLLPDLLRRNLVQTRPPPQVPRKLLVEYKPDLFCAFHQGAPGHYIEHCIAEGCSKVGPKNLIHFKEFEFECAG